LDHEKPHHGFAIDDAMILASARDATASTCRLYATVEDRI